MTNISKLTVEEMETILSLMVSRADQWNQQADVFGDELLCAEAARFMEELTGEQIRLVLWEARAALNTAFRADVEFCRKLRRHLWLDDQEGYTALVHQASALAVPGLVERTIQALNLRTSVVPSESGNGNPKWIQ